MRSKPSAILIAALTVGALMACGPSTPEVGRSVTSTTSAPRPVGESLPTATTVAGRSTSGLIGIVALGPFQNGESSIVGIDPDDGRVVGVLVDWLLLQEGAGHLSHDPSTGVVLFTRNSTACSTEISSLDIETLDLRVMGSGANPVISPDGRFLAYTLDPVCQIRPDVRILDLSDQSERIWESQLGEDSDRRAIVTELAWSPDGRTVVAEVLLDERAEIRLLDVTGVGGSIADSRLISPSPGATLTSPLFLEDGSLAVVESCCGPDPDLHRVVVFDEDGGLRKVLFELPAPGRLVDRHPTDGRLLLVLVVRDRPELWSYADGELRFVITDAFDAVWLVGHPPEAAGYGTP